MSAIGQPNSIYRKLALCAALFPASMTTAHPHVFVDGGVHFIMGAKNTLEALQVTWRYDAFETLYILSSYKLSLNDDGGLDEADRQTLVHLRSDWPEDFDGSAHLTVDGKAVPLEWPTGLDAHVKDGRLEVTFVRNLTAPMDLTQRAVDVAFYESTYFFAFSITDPPEINGPSNCKGAVTPFTPNDQDTELMSLLAKLGREETTGIDNVGATFADRIVLKCG